MAFQDRAQGICARLHLTPVRARALVGIVLVLGAVALAAALALAVPFAVGEAVVVERADAGGKAAGSEGDAGDAEVRSPDVPTAGDVSDDSGAPSFSGAAAEMQVHVDGAVKSPGVYALPAGSRVIDAVEAAGGLTEDARSSGVNLAQVLADGQQVVIPGAGDEVPAVSASPVSPGADGAGGLVNVNTASAAELTTLDGIGEATAEKIVADREANGPFASIDDLKRVSGIGEKKLAAIRDDVCL